ncbi:MAG: DUF3127 domain-containing protein [Tunicatimonas sp.]
MDIQGKLLEISDTVQIKETFRKRDFVVEYSDNPQYPEYVKFECIQDKCDMLDNYSVGQDVTVSFNLKGRKWVDPQGETKYFNSLQAWRMQPASGASSAPSDGTSASSGAPSAPTSPPAAASGGSNPVISAGEGEEDDLPF